MRFKVKTLQVNVSTNQREETEIAEKVKFQHCKLFFRHERMNVQKVESEMKEQANLTQKCRQCPGKLETAVKKKRRLSEGTLNEILKRALC